MDIIKIRREERLRRIRVVQKSIEKARIPDLERLKMICMSEWGVSDRTAAELIKVAQFNIGNKTGTEKNSTLFEVNSQ